MHLPAMSPALAAVRTRVGQALRAHLWFLLAIAAYGIALHVLAVRLDARANLSFSLYAPVFTLAMPVFAVVFVVGRVFYIMVAVRPRRLTRYLIADFRDTVLTPERLFMALPVFLVLPVFASMFTSVKAMIPLLQPFAWDTTFATWDQALHGGRAPWEWLQPVLGHPYVTSGLNVVYNAWLIVMYGVWMWQAFSTRDARLRMQFFLAFVVSWVLLGNVVATLLSSAGPCYFGRVTGAPDPYAGLTAYLRAVSAHLPVWSVQTQEMLWRDSLKPGVELGSGISAMPSMHVATSVLFALLGWRVKRRLGIAFTVFAVLVMLGSVHLAWHYAVDGYVGAAGAVAVWYAIGWFLSRDAFFRVERTGRRGGLVEVAAQPG
ncbi:MAG: phosphatase PAP2 family protein [Rhodospirillaceae bacterium]|nr:phosphatase PAP2 family protein [Rhodospirillaceae bacterium]